MTLAALILILILTARNDQIIHGLNWFQDPGPDSDDSAVFYDKNSFQLFNLIILPWSYLNRDSLPDFMMMTFHNFLHCKALFSKKFF